MAGDAPTRVIVKRPGGSSGGSPASGSGSPASTVQTPLDALWSDEIARSRQLVRVIGATAVANALAIPVLARTAEKRALFFGVIVLALAGAAWLWWITRVPARYTSGRAAVSWLLTSLAVTGGVILFGIFSPAPIVYVMGLYFVSLGHSGATALAVYVLCVVLHVSYAALVIGGVVHDVGLVTGDELDTRQQIVAQVLVQLVLAGAYALARASRQVTFAEVVEHDALVRQTARREALLDEVREELARVHRAGEPGRYSELVVGSYKLGVLLGRGAMGEVYEATPTGGGAPAAVKLLRRDALAQPQVLERFLREAHAAGRLDSPHVARVVEVAEDDAALPYLAMERLRGRDLAEILRERSRLPPAEVVTLAREVARGLDAAAAAGVVHRDVKPANLFHHEPDGGGAPLWKVLDFGVARLADASGTLTEGHVVGTPGYMAPEQAQGLTVDARADVYALAMVCYRALTGELPFRGAQADVVYQVVHKTPPAPSKLAPGLPEAVDAVFARALAKPPEARPPSSGAFADALAAALSR